MDGGEVVSADLTAVLEDLEIIQQSLDEANVRLEQLHADVSLVFLGVVLVVGVILGCAVGITFSRIWRS